MSLHHITAFHDPDGAETETRIHFTYHKGFAGRYYENPQPPEPASVEFDRVEMFALGKWTEAPKLAEWAEAYLMGDGMPDAFGTVADDEIAAAEYRAEMRADR